MGGGGVRQGDLRMETTLVAGRECGTCTVCCTHLTIDDPDLQKPAGVACCNLRPEGGCRIYDSRPHTCRTFYCGWRRLKWFGAGLRPYASRVLAMLVKDPLPAPGATGPAVGFLLLDRTALQAPGLAEAVAAAVNARIGAYLLAPGPPGQTFGRQRLNERLAGPVARKDKAGVLRELTKLRRAALLDPHRDIVLKPRKDEPPSG
jgi:hypothetical protein